MPSLLENRIIPSIIAESQEELDERVQCIKGIARWIQLDVMDGKFVPSHSLDFDFHLPESIGRVEAHLMLKDPVPWIKRNRKKVDTILFHIEPCKNPEKVVSLITEMGKKPGLCINPETPVKALQKYLALVSEVLVMTVKPGFYGARFLPETLKKVNGLRNLKPGLDIEVDGSMNPKTIRMALHAGANFFVVGSFLQKAKSPALAMEELKKALK